MSKFLKLLCACALLLNISTGNAAFVQTVTNGGDGNVCCFSSFFDLTSSNNNVGPSLLTYTDTFNVAGTFSFLWIYSTKDLNGSADSAGYIINGNQTQLSTDTVRPGAPINGVVQVNLNPGDVFGWYAFSQDSSGGAAALSIIEPTFKPAPPPGAVPLPAAAWLFGSAAIGLLSMRRRQAI